MKAQREVIPLYSKFARLSAEKRGKIIEACMEEFGQNSYDHASTNSIVKKAGISKGILFHYFGSKKNLYLFMFDYVLDNSLEQINRIMPDPPPDIFERITRIGFVKLKLAYEYPLMYQFFIHSIHVPDEVQKEIQIRYERMYRTALPIFFEGIDRSKFRPDIDGNKAMELIFFALEGLSNKYLRQMKKMTPEEIFSRMETLMEEYYRYIDILKGGVYGNPGQL